MPDPTVPTTAEIIAEANALKKAGDTSVTREVGRQIVVAIQHLIVTNRWCAGAIVAAIGALAFVMDGARDAYVAWVQHTVPGWTPSGPPPPPDTIPPPVPANLVATVASTTRVNLAWQVSADDGVVTYFVFRGATQLGSTANTVFTDTTVAAGATYSYTVKARDAAGNLSAASGPASATIPSPPPPPPTPPPPTPAPGTLTVGPGKQHATIGAAVQAAPEGSLILVDAGVYPEVLTVTKSLTFRGVGGRAHLKWDTGNHVTGTTTIPNGKGIVVNRGTCTFEGFEFSGAKVAAGDDNGAAIRQEAGGLTLRDCYLHDCQNGLLSGGGDYEILVESCEFARNGFGDGQSHNLYVGNVRKFTLRYSYSHDANTGHTVKSRALENHVLCNRIDGGLASYEVEFPNGGLCYVVGNVIRQAPETDNASIIGFAAEGATNATQALYVTYNTVRNDRDPGTFLQIGGVPSGVVQNNIFSGPGSLPSSTATLMVGTNIMMSAAPLFVDATGGDFRLVAGSPAIGLAVLGNDPLLIPREQYVHPLSKEPRLAADDPGAFDYRQ